MPTFNYRQIVLVTLASIALIWLLRLGTGDGDSKKLVRALEPLELADIRQKNTWDAKDFHRRLLVFVPQKKRLTAAEQEAALAAQLAKQKAEQAPPPVDKTIKPMFSKLDDDHQVGLLAVIESDKTKYAVLQKINFASKQDQNIKLQQSASFDGWTVSIESQTRVVLNKSDKKIYLNLFKPGNI